MMEPQMKEAWNPEKLYGTDVPHPLHNELHIGTIYSNEPLGLGVIYKDASSKSHLIKLGIKLNYCLADLASFSNVFFPLLDINEYTHRLPEKLIF